jgi:hypothetical protein
VKKFTVLVFSGALIFGISGCGSSDNSEAITRNCEILVPVYESWNAGTESVDSVINAAKRVLVDYGENVPKSARDDDNASNAEKLYFVALDIASYYSAVVSLGAIASPGSPNHMGRIEAVCN